MKGAIDKRLLRLRGGCRARLYKPSRHEESKLRDRSDRARDDPIQGVSAALGVSGEH
jgi:hypothetical protein